MAIGSMVLLLWLVLVTAEWLGEFGIGEGPALAASALAVFWSPLAIQDLHRLSGLHGIPSNL